MSSGLKKEFCLWMVGGDQGRVRKVRFTLRTLIAGFFAVALLGGGFIYVASDYARVQIQKAEHFFRLKRALEEKRHLEGTTQTLLSAVDSLQVEKNLSVSYEQQIRARLDELASLLETSDPGRMLAPALGSPRVRNSKGALSSGMAGGLAGLTGTSNRMTASSGNKPSSLRAGPESQGGVSSEEALDGLGGAEIDCSSLGADGRAECETQEASAKASLRLSSLPQALSSHTDTSSASTLSLAAQVPVTAQGLVLGSLDLDDKAIPRHHVLSLLDSYIDTLRVAPIGLPAPGYISSGYGYRLSPFHGGPSMHQGIDFSLPQGSPIYATGDGIVQNVNRHGTYGIVVDIAHSSRVVTRYAHMSKALIREGEKICRGEVVGLVGSTGRSTAPHLHYEVRIDGRSKNPLPFMRLALDLKNLFQDLEEQAV